MVLAKSERMTVVAPVHTIWFDNFDYIVPSAWSPCQLNLTKRNVRTRTLFQWPHYVPAQIQILWKTSKIPRYLSCSHSLVSLSLSCSLSFSSVFFLNPLRSLCSNQAFLFLALSRIWYLFLPASRVKSEFFGAIYQVLLSLAPACVSRLIPTVLCTHISLQPNHNTTNSLFSLSHLPSPKNSLSLGSSFPPSSSG